MKYSSKENASIANDSVDISDDHQPLRLEVNLKQNRFLTKNALISEIELENESNRLQNVLKQIIEDFSIKRKQLEDDCCEQLQQLNADANKAHRLQQDLEHGE